MFIFCLSLCFLFARMKNYKTHKTIKWKYTSNDIQQNIKRENAIGAYERFNNNEYRYISMLRQTIFLLFFLFFWWISFWIVKQCAFISTKRKQKNQWCLVSLGNYYQMLRSISLILFSYISQKNLLYQVLRNNFIQRRQCVCEFVSMKWADRQIIKTIEWEKHISILRTNNN